MSFLNNLILNLLKFQIMKKVIFLFTMVFAATFAMSQNTATTTQTGDDNSVLVEQVGSNTATVTQTATLLVPAQAGNDAEVLQVNGDGNISTVTQTGNTNTVWLNQGIKAGIWTGYNSNVASTNSTATIAQSGVGNIENMEQYGISNSAILSQTNTTNARADVYQGWAYSGWGETAITSALSVTNSSVSVTQVNGASDYVGLWQYGGDNDHITITQNNGDNNRAQVTQGFIYDDLNYNFSRPIYNVDDNNATVTQNGSNNVGKLMQLGNGNAFTLTQNGNGNKVGDAPGGLEPARNGYFKQDGDGNVLTGEQTDGAVLDATSVQTGDDNFIDMEQGAGDIAKIMQVGNLNDAYLTQMGGGQDATILQTGDLNVATVSQQ
jgi:hypothetical protein